LSQTPYRILVVDDEPLIARAIKRALAPYVVQIANDGEEALAALARNTFDAILCDLMMPRVSGADLYAHIEKNYPHLLNRIVFMTGGAFSDWSQRFLESVSCPVMEKPFRPLQLRECIESVAKKGRRNR
jgi:CheY-like chemotaxis protein